MKEAMTNYKAQMSNRVGLAFKNLDLFGIWILEFEIC